MSVLLKFLVPCVVGGWDVPNSTFRKAYRIQNGNPCCARHYMYDVMGDKAAQILRENMAAFTGQQKAQGLVLENFFVSRSSTLCVVHVLRLHSIYRSITRLRRPTPSEPRGERRAEKRHFFWAFLRTIILFAEFYNAALLSKVDNA